MSVLETLKIDLLGLDDGTTTMQFALTDDFFSAFESAEIKGGNVQAEIDIRRSGSVFYADIHARGSVVVSCDRCLDDMAQPVEADNTLTIRLGELPEDADPKATQYSDDDETMTVDSNVGIVDLAWFLYETVVLSLPIQHVHAPGKCNAAMIEAMAQYVSDSQSAARSDEAESTGTDPRWDSLKNLKFED